MSEDRNGEEVETLHLCNNYRHLLMAMADIVLSERKALLIYLDDVLPLDLDMQARLIQVCPNAEFFFTSDAAQIEEFAQLPRWLPAIMRRNIRLGGWFGVTGPHGYGLRALRGHKFTTGYIYHSGFFTSKAIAGLCAQVVLREDGLNNYVPHKIPWPKAIVRALFGLPPRYRIWGEEPWIDAIEVAHPQNLPDSVRHKGRKRHLTDLMEALAPERAEALANAFFQEPPQLPRAAERTALLLTQPLDQAGICTSAQQKALYTEVAGKLRAQGYRVFHKPHPRETPSGLHEAEPIPAAFPIEAWPFLGGERFDLAVTTFSSALDRETLGFAKRSVQLIPVEQFNAKSFPGWPSTISAALQELEKSHHVK